MTDNFMNKIADAMGMKIGDKFDLLDSVGDKFIDGPYTLTSEGIFDRNGDGLSVDESESFFAGRIKPIESDPIAEKLRNIEEELDLMDKELKDIANEIKELREKLETTTDELTEKIRIREEELESIREGE